MTRKEPQFGDDTGAAINTAPVDAATKIRAPDPGPRPAAPTPPPRTPWLLWMLVLISLAASFGMAFFGLEEAGRYQAALSKAEEQAAALEETIGRLNQTQTQGIGELAQSDAQMRKSLAALEKRLQAEVTQELTAFKKAQSTVNQTVASLQESLPVLERAVKAGSADTDEQLALLAEQLNAERTRVDVLTGQRDRLNTLAETMAALQSAVQALDATASRSEQSIQELTGQIASLETGLMALRAETEALASSSSNALGIELLSEQLDRVSEQVTQQGQLLEAVDASRRQLTQRLIDLDGRVNVLLQPKE